MTVGELIEKLKEIDQNAHVYVDTGHDCCSASLLRDIEIHSGYIEFKQSDDH